MKSKDYLIIICIVLLNFIIKGIFLSSTSIGGDEPFSIYHAQMDVASIIKHLTAGNNPPGYELFLHFWIKLFGISEFSVRFPSLVFSCIAVFFIYKIGNSFFNRKVAIIAGVLFIFSNYQIIYAHEARVYSLFGMLTAMSMYYYMKIIINDSKKRTDRIGFLATNIIMIYCHYFGFFVLLIQFIYLIFNRKLLLKYWKQLLIATGIIILFYIPNLIIFFTRFFDSASGGTWVSKPSGPNDLYNMLVRFSNKPVVAVSVILVFLTAFIKYIIKDKFKGMTNSSKLIVLWFIFPFLFMFLISYYVPMFLDRYLMFVTIGYYLAVAIASDYLISKKYYSLIIPGIICILFIATSNPDITNKRNVEETVDKINELKTNNTLVIICPDHFVLNYSYYHDIDIFKIVDTEDIYRSASSALKKSDIYGIKNINEIDYSKWDHIVYLDAAASFSHPDNNIVNTLDEKYNLDSYHEIYEIFKVYEYSSKQRE
ncbi:MAG: glycosyltransferase family 39 protein [Bacteroidales bacterium]|jgi:uncharacterized membrane protein|nr:glycosyltransferase family 39 protein [Bacteroidales bacterium]